jgi:hypothetical protein
MNKTDKPTKPRTAARSWGRVETIDKQLVKLTTERAEIVAELEGLLKKPQ